ncbi:hypothetical protein DUI87_08540 [Hirundo rustica rustica]|uniref:RNA-directed DNA polymerase n=1 Tax=Hirundo rustica rustica TaxID=333673 RepID=A0A3M0L2E6_HIRRU|nr:hypothetical protein DUI87_08540 [Hirundo rustica rustica]
MSTCHQEPLNVVSDALYVVGVAQQIEDALLRETKNPRLGQLFMQLRSAVKLHTEPYCIIHIQSHQLDQGLGEGNARADALVRAVRHMPPQDQFCQARNGHDVFHQNASPLRRQFGLSHAEAQGIVHACPQCSHYGPDLDLGVNPKGLKALEIWQMDVTHIADFGRLKHVHASVDTYIKMVWTTAQTGEKGKHICKHLTTCFAVMGVTENTKTVNGPAYISETVKVFM